MGNRTTAWCVAASIACGGCVTGTAHRLPLAGNPLREQAMACEADCRSHLKVSSSHGKYRESLTETESRPPPDRSAYAVCLDGCPGATAVDGASCPDLPTTDVICEKTYKANPGGIAGGAVAVSAVGALVVVLAAIATLPPLVLLVLLLSA